MLVPDHWSNSIPLGAYDAYGVGVDHYQWSVALILDPNERSKDIVASGFIDRVESSSELTTRLAKAGQDESAAVYADEGLWYDALASAGETGPAPGRTRAAH